MKFILFILILGCGEAITKHYSSYDNSTTVKMEQEVIFAPPNEDIIGAVYIGLQWTSRAKDVLIINIKYGDPFNNTASIDGAEIKTDENFTKLKSIGTSELVDAGYDYKLNTVKSFSADLNLLEKIIKSKTALLKINADNKIKIRNIKEAIQNIRKFANTVKGV